MTTTRRHRHDDPLRDPRVALVLTAAAAPTEPGPQPGEDVALAAFRGAVPTPTRRIRMLPSLKAAAIAATATGALLTGGIAAASTGALPGSAQDSARTALAKVGVTVPGPADAAGEHPAGRGTSAAATAEASATAAPAATEDANAHGKAVSELATTTDLTGRDKGAAVSALASGGRSKAGQHPTSTTTPTPEADAHGQATADEHSTGRSIAGTSHRP